MGECVNVQVTDGLATIRLDRPPMNAISVQVQAELRDAAAVVTSTPEIRAAVIYGGEKVFAAGADVKEMADKHYPEMALVSQAMHTSFTAVATVPKPVVAAVTGYALGGGLELALCADFRVCGESTKFGAARDSARDHSRCRRHTTAAAADRPGPRQGPGLHRAVRRRRRGAADRAGRPGGARRRRLRRRDPAGCSVSGRSRAGAARRQAGD